MLTHAQMSCIQTEYISNIEILAIKQFDLVQSIIVITGLEQNLHFRAI